MSGRCFVPGCKSGLGSVRKQYKKENRRHPQIFSAPKNWTMLQIWKHVIPGSDTEFSITDKICELHFTEDYVTKFHELPLKDGEIFKMERTYAKLKPGAIPTVFMLFPRYSENIQQVVDQMHKTFPLHVPEMDIKLDEHMESYLKIISEVRAISMFPEEVECEAEKSNYNSETEACEADKSSSNSESASYKAEKSNYNKNVNAKFENFDENKTTFCDGELGSKNRNESYIAVDISDKSEDINVKNVNSGIMDIEIEEQGENISGEITFDDLVRNVKSISKPNSSWSVTCHGNFVMCAKWNKEYHPEKRVVIDSHLNIKVFLNDKEIAAYNNCISDISDVSNVLSILNK